MGGIWNGIYDMRWDGMGNIRKTRITTRLGCKAERLNYLACPWPLALKDLVVCIEYISWPSILRRHHVV